MFDRNTIEMQGYGLKVLISLQKYYYYYYWIFSTTPAQAVLQEKAKPYGDHAGVQNYEHNETRPLVGSGKLAESAPDERLTHAAEAAKLRQDALGRSDGAIGARPG